MPRIYAVALLLLVGNFSAQAEEPAFSRTEERAPCANSDPLRQPFFGDLHVHTRYSFDSYVSSQRNDPWDAYRYAKGEPITLADEDGEQTVTAQIGRPLDFTAVTDHAEFLGVMSICTEDPWTLGYWWPHCIMTRSNHFWTQLLAAGWWTRLGVVAGGGVERSFACSLSDCDAAESEFWAGIQRAADDHYDRSAACRFTTFVGYEYTDAPDYKNVHRNVIFRNEHVTALPISTYDTGSMNFPELWYRLRAQCIEGGQGCDVLAIPHNPNLSGGLMFRDPKTAREAQERLFFEPVIELTQHKAASECRFDRLEGRGLDTEDELCDFEQAKADNLSMLGTVLGEVRTERAAPVPLDEYGLRNMARNVLKDGLALEQKTGTNPFKFGFVGSTDTHSATPGGTEEDNYVGHPGRRDSGYRNVQDHFYVGGLDSAAEARALALAESFRTRAPDLDAALKAGDAFYGGHHLPPLDARQLAARFGADFADAVEDLQAGSWSAPVRSSYGYHLVCVRERQAGRELPLDQVEAEIASKMVKKRSEAALQERILALRKRYVVELPRRAEP
jgi:hypothetical protein